MRTDSRRPLPPHRRGRPTPERFAIDRLQRLENEWQAALVDLEKEQISFSIFSDVCLPVSLLIVIVVWGYQLNTMIMNSDDEDNRLMLLVYGIGLIVISGTTCVFIAVRMSSMRPEKTTIYLQREILPLYKEQKRSQRFHYQTIPEIHRIGKKSTDILIV